MRNLIEYQITSDEVIQLLERKLQEHKEKQTIGDPEGFILFRLKQFVEKNREQIDQEMVVKY